MYEAASIDGANGRDIFFHITLPLNEAGHSGECDHGGNRSIKTDETVYLLTAGGPGNETQFMASYLYKQRFSPINTVWKFHQCNCLL